MPHGVFVVHIHRREGKAACTGQAKRLDAVVKLFQPADGAGQRHDMPAPDCQLFGKGGTKAAGSAGDQGGALGHGFVLSAESLVGLRDASGGDI